MVGKEEMNKPPRNEGKEINSNGRIALRASHAPRGAAAAQVGGTGAPQMRRRGPIIQAGNYEKDLSGRHFAVIEFLPALDADAAAPSRGERGPRRRHCGLTCHSGGANPEVAIPLLRF